MPQKKNPRTPIKKKLTLSYFFRNRRFIIISIICVLLLGGVSLTVALSQKNENSQRAVEQQTTNTPAVTDDKDQESKTPQEATDSPTSQTSKPALSMKLSGQSTADNKFKLSWKTSGVPEGTYITLLFSRKTSTPAVYDFSKGEKATSFVNIRDKQSFTWDYPDGKTVWFRLCAYNLDDSFGQEKLSCNVGLSNVISYQAPYIAEKVAQSGAVNLTAEGTVLSWTFGGTAPFGFTVVGFSFIEFEDDTTSTSMDIGSTPSGYDYFYVCKKGYYEMVDCSKGISVER